MEQRHPPGPVGTSCLTCKRRHKKCDQGRPACERCIKGGHQCLGYDHIQGRTMAAGVSSSSDCPRSGPFKSAWLGAGDGSDPVGQEPDQLTEFSYDTLVPEVSTYGLIMPSPNSSPNAYPLDLSFIAPENIARITSIGNSRPLLLPENNQSWELARPPAYPLAPGESESQSTRRTLNNLSYLRTSIEPRMARSLSVLSPDARQAIAFIVSQMERLLNMAYFTPRRQQTTHFRDVVVKRLQTSSVTRCAVFLVAKVVQSRLDRTTSDNRASLNKMVEQFEQRLLLVSSRAAASPDEVQRRLDGFLEVSYLKMLLSDGILAYQVLHNVAPTFLQIVYSDPTLWPNPCGPPTASLAHMLSSTRFEIRHFVMMDTTCAMAFGLPQIVAYDTSVPFIHNRDNIHPIQHIRACPPELQICLAEINLRCSNGYISHDWHLIERRLVSYKPCLAHSGDPESWKLVAQLAVAETWRQVLLIYLYMAVCGVDSDDPRVQSAVQQIFQLFKTVPRQDPPRLHANFMFQYLIAGACTRSEKQRAYIRKRLLDSYEGKFWLLPGSDFVPVLDHLWHGTAANGQAFKWSDYIFSRQTALPVPI